MRTCTAASACYAGLSMPMGSMSFLSRCSWQDLGEIPPRRLQFFFSPLFNPALVATLEHGASIRHLPSRSPHACQCGLSSRVEPSLTDVANVTAVLDYSLLDGTVPCSHRSSSRPSRSVSDSLRCDSSGALQAFACVTSTLHGPQSTANGHADAQMAAAAAAAPLLLLPPSDTPYSLQAIASSKRCGRSSEYRQRRLASLVQASARGAAYEPKPMPGTASNVP